MSQKCNAAGIRIIQKFEGLQLRAYRCPGGVWTIGYGSTGLHVHEGMVISPKEAEALLGRDLERFEKEVASLVRVPVSSNQFSALVSFAFNVGSDIDADNKAEGLGDSTLLRKLNAGAPAADVAAEFKKWVFAAGKRLPGLVKRRRAEAELFLAPS